LWSDPARTVSFQEGREKIAAYLRQVKIRDEAKTLALELRGKARVEVFLAEGNQGLTTHAP
jgi:hypothetical protein